MDSVPMEGRGVRVRAYFGERDRQHGRPLWSVLLEFLRHEHVAGATVTRGVAGYGANSKIHAASIVDLVGGTFALSDRLVVYCRRAAGLDTMDS